MEIEPTLQKISLAVSKLETIKCLFFAELLKGCVSLVIHLAFFYSFCTFHSASQKLTFTYTLWVGKIVFKIWVVRWHNDRYVRTYSKSKRWKSVYWYVSAIQRLLLLSRSHLIESSRTIILTGISIISTVNLTGIWYLSSRPDLFTMSTWYPTNGKRYFT